MLVLPFLDTVLLKLLYNLFWRMLGGRAVLPPLTTPYKVGEIKTSFLVIVARAIVYNYDLHSAATTT
jgi:hypothetical protein